MINKNVLISFILWRLSLFIILLFAVQIVPLQLNFLGGGVSNYLQKPYIWAWSNYDGEHYLSIARSGYQSLTYFFFPLYPSLIKQLSTFLTNSFENYLYSALFISNAVFIIALQGLYMLVKMDFGEKTAFTTILLLLFFPTSFYFGSVYTESLFLALVVWSFYFARKGYWYLSGIFGGLSTAARITGLALLPAILAEYCFDKDLNLKKMSLSKDAKNIISILIISAGLIAYMLFLFKKTGDPLAFFHNLNAVFGEQRAVKLIMLPQVFYRYVFKILPNLTYNYFPIVFSTLMEFITAMVFFTLVVISFVKLKLSYAFYSLFSFLIPTLSGSFSSLPRYVLIMFPSFILIAIYLQKIPKHFQYAIYILLAIGLIITTALFSRGYWVA